MKFFCIKIIPFVIIHFQLVACSSSKSEVRTDVDSTNTGVVEEMLLELDVSPEKDIVYYLKNKEEIPVDFMKNRTVIDSFYYNGGEGPYFQGDTIYELNDNYYMGVVNYHGLVCMYKILLIIDSKSYVNTSYLLGSRDCDRDGDENYYYYSFYIEKGRIVISENMVAKGGGEENSIIVETIEYLIDDKGKFFLYQNPPNSSPSSK